MTPIDFNYPPELPVTGFRDEIVSALEHNQVVIVCGDTGSGKTTQLPKMALERFSRIACTQPRRLAAVTMAARVAQELKSEVGALVGYQHRFAKSVSRDTQIKFMTDGVLLAETRNDPLLRAYNVIIVDEAHERSLNVDFLLGILKRILPRRRDLRVIVSSATLDVGRFAKFFDNAPVVSVPGRLFPIEYIYAPPREDDELDLPRDVLSAVLALPKREDILVFLPGERDIRETADALQRHCGDVDDVIPLLASLPAAEQQRAFKTSPRRRIILATNVAETSVTIPGIRCVIDSGLARISRYIHRTQVQRLQIEPISQASARQRAGRCGRLGPGTCVRLYSEEDFNSRDAYTAPEVLRSSLAGVILTMLDLRLGDVSRFPFIDPPKTSMVNEGLRELLELGAVRHDENGEVALTETGRKLAKIPVEPRLARMLIAASDNGILPSVIPIVAALSCDDPRRRPVDEREKAAQAHAPFRFPNSDFLGMLKLWTWWTHETDDLSQAKARSLAKKTYLSYPKMREWRDLVRQLGDLSKRLNLFLKEDFTPNLFEVKIDDKKFVDWSARIHRSLLSGLLGRIGRFDAEERNYRGAHAVRFSLHPSSALGRKSAAKQQSPQWVFAGELVDTAKLFARTAAVLDPMWIEPVARGICKHSYHSPEWDAASGFVRATEQVTLYGLVIVPARRCDYSRVNFDRAREIFITHALVNGEYPHPPPEVRKNIELLNELRRRADKMRRAELFDEERLGAFFAKAIPRDVASVPALNKWLRSKRDTARFVLRREDWFVEVDSGNADFPDFIKLGNAKMRLEYHNSPDDPERDGITCTARKADAAALKLWRADWLVPGALREKIVYLISTLPSAQRRILQPLEDVMNVLMTDLKPGSEPLVDNLRKTIYDRWALRVAPEVWANVRMPPHLQVRFRIVDADGRVTACSRNLEEALLSCGISAGSSSIQAVRGEKKRGQSPHISSATGEWVFGKIPETAKDAVAGWELVHYPALRDEGEKGIALHLFADAKSAVASHASGVTALFLKAIGNSLRKDFKRKSLSFQAQMYLKSLNYDDAQLSADIFAGAVREAYVRNRDAVRDGDEFRRRLEACRSGLIEVQFEMTKIISSAFEAAAKMDAELERGAIPEETVDSIQTQIAWLLYRGFPKNVPLARLRNFKRYFNGIEMRIARARTNPGGDISKEARLGPYWQLYEDAVTGKSKVKFDSSKLVEIRWMIEEFRVSLFAQELRTPEPVSEKRLDSKFAAAVVD